MSAILAVATSAAPASADVFFQALGGETPRDRAPILVAPDGSLRQLADPGGSEDDGYQYGTVSPDRRLVALTSRSRIGLLPTDGGRPRVVGPAGLRTTQPEDLSSTDESDESADDESDESADDESDGSSGGGYSIIGYGGGPRSAVWWDADGRLVLRDGVETTAGTPVVVSCAVDSGSCTTRDAPRGLIRVGGRRDGGSLWTADSSLDLLRLLTSRDLRSTWRASTPTAVRRARTTLRRPVADQLRLVSPDGTQRVLWRSRRSTVGDSTGFSASEDGDGGTIVLRSRSRFAVQTRRRSGRLQARLRSAYTDEAPWRIDPAGRRSTLKVRSAEGDVLTSVGTAIGARGWLGIARHGSVSPFPVTVDAAGGVRRLLVGGRAATARALHAALGLTATASTEPGLRYFELPGLLEVSGYEAATDSAVVSYYGYTTDGDSLRQIVARLPLAGGPPSLVVPPADRPEDEPRTTLVTAW